MADYGKFTSLKVEKDGKVLIITLNRPAENNVFNEKMHHDVVGIFGEVADDDTINAIVLTGAGRMFSAGGDIEMMRRGEMPPPEEAIELIQNILKVKQPLIAALNGHAIGVAATVALFCDIIIASEEAKIGDPHVNVGLVAGDGGCIIWPLLIGMCKAKEMLLTGKSILAKDAEKIGLINYAVPAGEVMNKAMEIAHSLAHGPAKAIQWTKMAINKKLVGEVNLILQASTGFEYLSMHTEDHKEAVSAFLEKRKPKFSGR